MSGGIRINDGDNELLTRNAGVKTLKNVMYGVCALNGLFWFLMIGLYILSIILYFEYAYVAFEYTHLWFGAVLSFAFLVSASIVKPVRGIMAHLAVVDAFGVSTSLLGLVGAGTYIGVALVSQWECQLDLGTLSVVQDQLCASGANWVAFTLWWMNIPVLLMMLFNGGAMAAHFMYCVGASSIA